MKSCTIKLLLIAVVLMVTVSAAEADTKGRIIPDGRVSLLQDGRVVASFTEQAPIDDKTLISCDGACMVKMRGFSLIAADQSVFGVKEMNGPTALYVDKGMVHFIVADTTRQLAFFTPDGHFIKTEGFLVPASTESSVRGFVNMTDKGTEIGMENGSMIVQTANGLQTIKPGNTILLAGIIGDDAAAGGGALGLGGSSGGGALFGGASLGQGALAGAIALGGAAGVVGLKNMADNNNSNDTLPSGPADRYNPASPNQ